MIILIFFAVIVNVSSVAPTGATGTLSIACGGNTTLTVAGGSAGTGAIAEWFTGSCGGASAGTGNSINVLPASTTTYYVRYNGTCNTTTCGSVTVTVAGCSSIVNLKLFIQAYYDNSFHAMRPVKFNQDGISPLTDVENITVELHNATIPWATVATTTALLKTNGTAICTFNTSPSGSYYIAVKIGNAIQTWSTSPQLVGAIPLTYDFTTATNKAYGDNMLNLGGGVFGFYSGDINQDDVIDNTDAPDLVAAIESSAFGNQVTDLNGDGAVDNSDAPFFENNATNSIFAIYPQ